MAKTSWRVSAMEMSLFVTCGFLNPGANNRLAGTTVNYVTFNTADHPPLNIILQTTPVLITFDYDKVLEKVSETVKQLCQGELTQLFNRNDSIYSKLINLNAGYEDKIKKNMSAINERGLVGKVIDTTSNNSRVILLTDPNLSISVKSISDGIFSLLTGNGDGKYLVSSFVKENKMPRLGDIVVTSGTAQIFPVDLLVGKVAKVEKNRFFVLPFVDFKNIDYVQIVTSK